VTARADEHVDLRSGAAAFTALADGRARQEDVDLVLTALKLTDRQTVVGTLLASHSPDPSLARERARRAQIANDTISRWGKPLSRLTDPSNDC